MSWGRYSQFPDIQSLFVSYGNEYLLPARSDHYAAPWEQRLGSMTRLRLEVFERRERNLLFQPFMDARLLNGVVEPDFYQSPLSNSLAGVSKGFEFFVQRRTANGWTGWLSYTFSHSEMHDRLANISFPSNQDQKHSVSAYASYRLRPSVNLSSKFIYGSGFPIPGFLQLEGGSYFLAASRNGLRLPSYQRLDLRLNKSKSLKRGKMTYYLEGTNILNRGNYRFDSYNGYEGNGRAYISLAKMFPILPSAGVVFEF